jgi:superfamily II DNA or RNA helicase
MLGASATFGAIARLTASAGGAGGEDDGGRELLAKAMRPVILRRTKSQVAPELPERVEQTLEVELEPGQRRFYDALLARYRRSVLERVDRDGMNRARMHILEALLRLRQAACHPALADPRRTELPSAKLDTLMPALAEVMDEGHKVIVFSQFTSFLALVRERLDKDGVRYEYLDGHTRDRQAHVDRFQNDPAVPLFLVSLKAGGHGLNLTAADYVYLLDPWWNPAVEAQAIDRTHRIGQMRRVIARVSWRGGRSRRRFSSFRRRSARWRTQFSRRIRECWRRLGGRSSRRCWPSSRGLVERYGRRSGCVLRTEPSVCSESDRQATTSAPPSRSLA